MKRYRSTPLLWISPLLLAIIAQLSSVLGQVPSFLEESAVGTIEKDVPLETSPVNACRDEVIAEQECDKSEESCKERCNIHGTTYLFDTGKCCSHVGVVATLLAFEKDDLWVDRLREYNGCTGGEIRLKYNPGGEDEMASDLLSDVGGSDGSGGTIEGAHIYDAYIVQAPWIPAVEEGLAELNTLIADNADTINWLDINPVSRSAVSFGGKVKALPLDTDYIAFGYRQDVFEKHNITKVPSTLEELVETSEFLNGKDHNDDGIPDWGFCLTPQSNYFMAFVAPILQTHLQECREDASGEQVCDGSQTQENIFFDAQTFTPLIYNEGFKYAVKLYQRFLMASNCQSQHGKADQPPDLAYCNRKTAVPTGRCAGVISMPGTMTKLLQNGKYGVADGAPDGPAYEMPLPEFDSKEKYWGRRVKFPGSSKVWDRSTGLYGKLSNCTTELCPKALLDEETGKLVNYAPFFSEGGESYAINQVSKASQQTAMWDLFSWFADFGNANSNSDLVPLSGKYRLSHLKEPENISDQDVKTYVMEKDLNAVLQFYFADDQTDGGNAVQDLLIIGFAEYMNSLDEEIHNNFLLVKGKGFQDFKDDEELFDLYYNEFITALGTRYEEITAKYGQMEQLQRWRNSLNLQEKTDEEICALTLTSEENFERHWSSESSICSQFVLRDLCETERKSVVAYNAEACRAEGAKTSKEIKVTLNIIAAVGMLFSVGVIVWVTVNANHPIVRISQVMFMYMILLGSIISITTIFLLPIENNNAACMAQPWLFCFGFAITFSCLFAKTWRIKTMITAVSNFKRVVIKESSLLIWTVLSIVVFSIILLAWTALSPMVWYDNGIDSPRCVFSDGSYNSAYFTVPIAILILGAYLYGNMLLYQSRHVETMFAEREQIHTAMFANFEIFLIGVPVFILVDTQSADASLLIKAGIIFLNTITLLGLLFVPKMYKVATISKDDATSIIKEGMQSAASRRETSMKMGRPSDYSVRSEEIARRQGSSGSGGHSSGDESESGHKGSFQEAAVQKAPVQEASVQEASVQRAPLQEASVREAPGQDAPVQDAPVQAVGAHSVATDNDQAIRDKEKQFAEETEYVEYISQEEYDKLTRDGENVELVEYVNDVEYANGQGGGQVNGDGHAVEYVEEGGDHVEYVDEHGNKVEYVEETVPLESIAEGGNTEGDEGAKQC